MPATGITAVKDALVSRIDAAWITLAAAQATPPTTGQTARESERDEVVGAGRIDLDVSRLVGRKVYVFRSGRADTPVDRAEDQYDYTFVIWVVERFEDGGDPTEEWIDARVAWVEWLLVLVGSVRTPPTGNPLPGIWPEAAEITTVYDVEDLSEHKAFSSVLTVTYREVASEA